MAIQLHDWVSPIGGNWAYWAKNVKLIGEFIRVNAIKPAAIRPVVAGETPSAKALIDLGIRGGIRVAHLHFHDQIYMLNDEQWAMFSANIIADVKAKLAEVKEVSFQDGILLGNLAQTLARE
jgi:hypothetical protein